MITLQRDVSYAGDPTKTSLKSVDITFQVPAFRYTRSSDRSAEVTRDAGLTPQSTVVTQAVDAKSYRAVLPEAFLVGADDASSALAGAYELSALEKGDADALTVGITVLYTSSDGQTLGQQAFDILIIPKTTFSTDRIALAAVAGPSSTRLSYFAVSKAQYTALRRLLAGTSVDGNEALILRVLSLVASLDGDTPTYLESAAAVAGRWLDQQTQESDSAAVLKLVKKNFDSLVNFALLIPEAQTLTIAGTLKVLAPADVPVGAKDFTSFQIEAECRDTGGAPALTLTFQFDDATKVKDDAAPFSLAPADPLYRNAVEDPVVVRVRGVAGTIVWSREYKSSDPTLAKLEISVPIQVSTPMSGPPDGTRPEVDLKLRGRVVTFKTDCALKDVLVLVEARTSAESPWRIVGAATTDASGNFGMPYPYGSYVEAKAVVSLAPQESVDIPIVAKDGDVTISDDFLYVLVKDPECPGSSADPECDCSPDGKPNRLPDFSDLIGSDAYTQDIGGACVNLSKPNRTLSEFSFKAIVRLSDPDVANYTLTRVETGLDKIDVSLVAPLESGAVALSVAFTTAKNVSIAPPSPAWTASQRQGQTYFQNAVDAVWSHVQAVGDAFAQNAPPITPTVLATVGDQLDAIAAILEANKTILTVSDVAVFLPTSQHVIDAAKGLKSIVLLAIDSLGSSARYELVGGAATRSRSPVGLGNPVEWQDAPEPTATLSGSPLGFHPLIGRGNMGINLREGLVRLLGPDVKKGGSPSPASDPSATFSQAVSVATGHILHYKALFKADGYSLGDLLYSLPLAPGQKKEIVVVDSSHTLVGAESQAITQNERLAMGLVDERDITSQLAGNLSESLRGSSFADTRGISAGLGTGGQGYGGTGAYGGSGSAVIGVAGGVAQASADAAQDSSRAVAEFFREKLRQSIMQNAEGYRQLNASVVTTVQEGQRYGVTSEVVANHNHCHALTMMYFEVLRHYAIFQELSAVEECVFVPFLLTRFTTENVAKWRDVLASALLPIPSDTYLQALPGPGRQHPLLKAFDADQRIRTHYANVDYPAGSYDDEPIQFIKGTIQIRINIPRPRTRYDRILSFPVTKQVDTQALAEAASKFAQDAASYGAKAAATAGIWTLFNAPTSPPNPEQYQVLAREAIFDTFMTLDANFQNSRPADCIRIKNFKPPASIAVGLLTPLTANTPLVVDFFAENVEDRKLWQAYANLLGYTDVLTMLNAYFQGNLISEWDTIFNTDIAPRIFEKVLASLRLQDFSVDWASEVKYQGGERLMRVNLIGTTSKKRNQLPLLLNLQVTNAALKPLAESVTLVVEELKISYSTAHYNGMLFSGSLGDDLLDGSPIPIPETPDEKRNPRREDRYLAAKLIDHLNSNLEYYNKVLWRQLDPDRRYMLLDGFSIQVYDEQGKPITGPSGMRSLASVIKNEMITVAGNSLVFPVAPGYRVSGALVQVKKDGAQEPATLFDHYKPLTPMEPYRVSVPSKGVFAEAVQGACNACEKIETERLQDWSRFPNTDEPTSIAPVVTPTPTVTDWRAAFKDFAAPIVNVQNAPAAPAPGAGFAGLADLLGKSGVFKDITGLDATQQNAIRTYLSNQENAKSFAEMAKEMAMQTHNTQNSDKIMDSIKGAKSSGAINQQEYGQLVKDHLQQQIDGGQSKKADIQNAKESAPTPYSKALVEAASRGQTVSGQRTVTDTAASESVSIGGAGSNATLAEVSYPVEPLAQSKDKKNDCWAVAATMMVNWKNQASAAVEDAIAPAGDRYLQIYRADTGLTANDKNGLLGPLGMTSEGAASYPASQYITWLKTYGPLWITTDAAPEVGVFSPHARVLIKITGTGDSDLNTYFTFIDPASGQIENPQNFTDFIRSFEQMVTDLDKTSTLFPQVVHFVDQVAAPSVEGGKPAPAQKTGISGLADNKGNATPFAAKVLSESKSWIDAVADGIANWKDSPSAELRDAIGAALFEAAKTAAQEATDDIPFVQAMKVAVKYSLVFADGIGAGIATASQKLSAKYDRATNADPGSNGYSQDDYDALLFARRWQLNSVNELSDIVLAGVNEVLNEVIDEFASWATDTVFKKFSGISKSLVGHLLEKSPLKAVVYGALDAGSAGISKERQEIYRATLSTAASLFIRQLASPGLRATLMPYTKLGGSDPMGKALLKATASCLVDKAMSDPEVKQFTSNIKTESRAWIVDHLRSLKQNLAAGVTVAPGDLAVVGDEVRIPDSLLQEINLGTAAFADQDFQKSMNLTMALQDVKKATENRLTLLARVRQPRLVSLNDTDQNAYGPAYNAYRNEVSAECSKLTQTYQAAGADPNSSDISNEKITFQTIDARFPKLWCLQSYSILPPFLAAPVPYRGR